MAYLTAEVVERPAGAVRRAARRLLRATTQLRRGTIRETVELRDLSPGGARLRALAPLRAGCSIWLQLPGIAAQEARIVWSRGCESGLEFVRPLHPAVFDSLFNPG